MSPWSAKVPVDNDDRYDDSHDVHDEREQEIPDCMNAQYSTESSVVFDLVQSCE